MTNLDVSMPQSDEASALVDSLRPLGMKGLRSMGAGPRDEASDLVDALRANAKPPTFEDLGYRYLTDDEKRAANSRVDDSRGFWSTAARGAMSASNLPLGFGAGVEVGKLSRWIYLDNKLRSKGLDRDEELEHVSYWAELSRDPGVLEMAGDVVGAMPGFAVDVIASGGVAKAAAAPVKRLARESATRIIRDRAASQAEKEVAKRIARGIGGAAAVGGAVAGVAAATVASEALPSLVHGGGRWTAYALQKALPELRGMDSEDWEALEGLSNEAMARTLKADLPLWQGAIDTAIELSSEFAGAPLGRAMQATWAGSRLLAMQARVLQKVAGAVDNVGADMLGSLAKRVRYDGFIQEYLEERLGDVARVATGLEEPSSLIPEADETLAEVIALSFPSVGAAGVRRMFGQQKALRAKERADALAKGEVGAGQDFAPSEGTSLPNLSDAVIADRVSRLGVADARVVQPETGEERLAADYAAMSGRRMALVDSSSDVAWAGFAAAPDLMVVSRAEASPGRIAAHELTETVGLVSTDAERVAQAARAEAIAPGILDRAFAEWQGRVDQGGQATQGDPEKLKRNEGLAVSSEWVAPLMMYAARNTEGRRAVERLAAEDSTGFWRRLWDGLRSLLGRFTADGQANAGARAALRAVPSEAKLTQQEASTLALQLQDWIQGSEERVRAWRAKNPTGGAAAPVAVEAPVAETAAAPGDAAEATSIPTRDERVAEKERKRAEAKAAVTPEVGDIVRVTSQGNQGLADVLSVLSGGRLRVRLRSDVQGEPGGRATTGNRRHRTVEVPRAEVKMHHKRAAVGPRGATGATNEARDESENLEVSKAKRPVTVADPVKAWSDAVKRGRKKGKRRSVAASAPVSAVQAPAVATPLPALQGGVEPVRAPRAAVADPVVPFDEQESEEPGIGHQTELPMISQAEERLARTLAQRFESLAPEQTHFEGHRGEFLKKESRNLGRLLAANQDAEEIFDFYAGGGSYGLSVAAARALPKLKRITINEVDPLRSLRLRLAIEEGGSFLDAFDSHPFLQSLLTELERVRSSSKSASPVKTAIDNLRGEAQSKGYERFRAMRSGYEALGDREKAAIVALIDSVAGSRKAKTVAALLSTARQDFDSVKRLASATRANGVELRIVGLDATGSEAVSLVQSAGKSFVLLDPPYHRTATGSYSVPGGATVRMGSDQALAMYVQGLAQMAPGNAVVYHNNATEEARDMLYRAVGGHVHIRTWQRQQRGAHGKQTEVVGYVYGQDLARRGGAGSGDGSASDVAGAGGGSGIGDVLGRAGGDPGSGGVGGLRGNVGPGAQRNRRGGLEARFEAVGLADYLFDALNGLSGEARSRGASLLAEQSMAEAAAQEWDPFDGYDLPVSSGVPRIEQSLQERLARRTAAQRRETPLTLVDHVLAFGGIDLRLTGATNEAGELAEAILGGQKANAAGVPSGLIYLADSKAQARGLTPDDLRERLRDAGFLGTAGDDRMSFDAMLEGIVAEISGEMPTFTAAEVGLTAVEAERLETLDQTRQLSSLDIGEAARAEGASADDDWLPFSPAGMRPWAWETAPAATLPERVRIDGVERATRNSEGLPLADAWHRIVGLWRWFGGSPEVDGRGRPVVLYRAGTFKPAEHVEPDGLYFYTAAEARERAAEDGSEDASVFAAYRRNGEEPAVRALEAEGAIGADESRVRSVPVAPSVSTGARAAVDDPLSFAPRTSGPQVVQARTWLDKMAEWFDSDIHEVGRVQDAIWESTGRGSIASDFVGAIDLARSQAPAAAEDLMQRLDERVARFKGKATLAEIQRLVYAKTAPFRNAWLRVDIADRWMRGRLEDIDKRLRKVGATLTPRQLGALQGEVAAIEKVQKLSGAERVTYARRRGVKVPESPSGLDDLTAASELSRLRRQLGATEADSFMEWLRGENLAMLQKLARSGRISSEMAEAWHTREPYYVSLQDMEEEFLDTPGYVRSARSFRVGDRGLTRAKGRQTEAQDGLLGWLENKLAQHEIAARNEALLAAAELAKLDSASGLSVISRAPTAAEAPFAVKFYENGSERHLLLPTEGAAKALKGLHGVQVGELLGRIGHVTRWFSRMVTSRNPVFPPVNFMRDTVHAFWTLGVERAWSEGFDVFVRAWQLLPSVMAHSLGRESKHADIIRQAKLDGIQTTWIGARTVRERMERLASHLSDANGPKAWVDGVAELLDGWSEGFELATRLATYMHDVEAGLSRREASLNAKNLTVNFDRKGTVTPTMSALFSFFNPGVQGSMRLVRAALDGKRAASMVAGTVAFGFAWEVLCYALSDDDDKTGLALYGMLPTWEREGGLQFPLAKGGHYLSMPLPYGIRSIVGFGRHLAHLLIPSLDPRRTAAGEISASFYGALGDFSPLGDVRDPIIAVTPTILKPFVEIDRNEKFGGRKIMRDKAGFGEEIPDSARAFSTIDDRASGWIAHQIAHVLNAGGPEDIETGIDVSPESLQHVIEWVTSGFGLRELDRVSQFAFSSRDVPVASNTPFLRNFVDSVQTEATSQAYYELRDRAQSVWKRAKDRRGSAREDALAQDPVLFQMATRFRQTDRRLRQLQGRMDGASREERRALQEQRLDAQAQMVRSFYGRE